MLVESSGFSIEDLRGSESVETRYREQTGLVAALRRRISWLADPEPVREVVKTSTHGLLDREVEEFAILHDERAQMQREQSGSDGTGGSGATAGAGTTTSTNANASGFPSGGPDRLL